MADGKLHYNQVLACSSINLVPPIWNTITYDLKSTVILICIDYEINGCVIMAETLVKMRLGDEGKSNI